MPLFNPDVTSLAKFGDTLLTGDVTLSAGSGMTLTESGQNIQIAASGTGNVVGPASSTDNAVTRFDGTTGKLIQNSTAILGDDGTLLISISGVQSGSLTGSPFAGFNPALTIASNVSGSQLGYISHWVASSGALGAEYVTFQSRGTLSSPTVTQAFDELFSIYCLGRSGNSYRYGAQFSAIADSGGTGANGAPVPSYFTWGWSLPDSALGHVAYLRSVNSKPTFELVNFRVFGTGSLILSADEEISFRNDADTGYINIIARRVGIGIVPTYGFHIAATSGLIAGQTVFIQDATASTGQTKGIVKAGAGQSTTNLWEWQDVSGNVLAKVASNGDLSVPDEAFEPSAWDGSVEVPTKNAVRDAILTTTSGTYTPTTFNVANLDATPTAYIAQWLRVGSTVTVSGKIDVNPTTTLLSTKAGISLPVASAFTTSAQCGGTAFAPTIANQGAAILADDTNDRAQMEWIASDITNQPMYFTFSYQVL